MPTSWTSPGAITCGPDLAEARRLLASALLDPAELALEAEKGSGADQGEHGNWLLPPFPPVANPMHKKRKSGRSGKEAAEDIPSWAQGERPLTTESGHDFTRRLLDDKYGAGNYPTGPGSEFSKIRKWGDRAFE